MSIAMTTQLTGKLAERLGMEGGEELVNVLKATAFKGQVSDAQMTALLIVANQYGLNPWTKEIYAFPDKNNGIVPVVGVDGWSRIINEHPQFDGIEFKLDDESCTCIIYRKDRTHATSVTEYMNECKRGAGPWMTHPKRMLRHKSMIQCARLAFGFVGIFDKDEAERIAEIDMGTIDRETGEVSAPARPELQPYSDEAISANIVAWRGLVESGKKTADGLIAFLKTKNTLTADQEQRIRNGLLPAVDAEFTAAYESAEREPGEEG